MPDLLLEVGCEELPSSACREIVEQAPGLARQALDAAGLNGAAVRVSVAPRRFALRVDGLPAELRKGIQDAAVKAEDRAIPAQDGIPEAHIQQLRDKGMNVTVLSKAQEKVMADAMQPAVIKAFIEASPDGARLIEMMRKL